ncbi:APC family permease [Luteolibacter ambystomatis]|uniref:APC family permease n=1 Tax=Luteolibacter ambystomatis TaxID=2824561 RepID=A0A975J0V1_9BACT|nr:APC family permease [Luteolibacter ambystomatis]QUE51932.1 APC family permease [Luteolibacter ambystomatis]
MNAPPTRGSDHDPGAAAPLERGLGLLQATSLNIANMVGIGPFITIPLFLATMNGPQAMIGWVLGAVLVLCDGLVWSELGAALPGSGGTYHFLKEIFRPYRWGRLLPFLFVWQFLISGTLEMASGYVGAVDYLKYAFPDWQHMFDRWGIPWGWSGIAALGCVLVVWMLSRRTRVVGWLAVGLTAGTLLTVLIVIVAGLTHFNPSLLKLPPDAFNLNLAFLLGLGGAMRIAVYDFLGYFNVCHLGDEVRTPGKTIPRAVILSVLVVATIYLTMNLSIIGVVPWQEAMKSQNVAALFMERLFGRPVAVAFTGLIVWTAIACMFAITLGYSRIPYAAAREGDFFRVFGKVHPRDHYPWLALMAMGALTAVFCFFPLQQIIDAAVTVRIVVQFMGQIIALHVLRTTRPDIRLPFRMWLYPLPSFIAFIGWIFLWVSSGWTLVLSGGGVIVSGCVAYVAWRKASNRTTMEPC